MYTQTFGGKLFLAPITENPTQILDLGTGTGIWAIDVADEFPGAAVLGTDLSPSQPTWVPPNCKFMVDDAEADFAWQDNTYDLVHIRGLHGAIQDWPKLYRQCYRILRPGGRVAVSDILARGPLPETIKNSMALYVGCIAGASEVAAYERYLNEAGFEGKCDLYCPSWLTIDR